MQIIQTRSDPRDLCASFQECHQPLAEPQLDWHTARSRADLFYVPNQGGSAQSGDLHPAEQGVVMAAQDTQQDDHL